MTSSEGARAMNGEREGQSSIFDLVEEPACRRSDHETSVLAAKAVAKISSKVGLRVVAFGRAAGESGITDSELKNAFPEAPESTYRKRRTELTKRGIFYDSGRRRKNEFGRLEIVWMLREGI